MRLSAVAALAWILIAGSAHADDAVTVWLKDGSIVRGELVERVPDNHVTLKLATGEVRRIEWKDLDHDSLGAKKSEPSPEPAEPEDDSAHKPNEKAKAVSDYVPPDVSKPGGVAEGAARITGADGYFLQRLEGTFSGSGYSYGPNPKRVTVSGEIWKTVCPAPCNEALPPGTYRIDGDGIPTSSKFELRGNEQIAVSPGNSAGYYGGRLLFFGGAFAAVLGGIIYAGDSGQHEGITSMSQTLIIGGLGGVVIGLPLWLLSRTTVDVKGAGSASLRVNGVVF
jgi:hypothetical protein